MQFLGSKSIEITSVLTEGVDQEGSTYDAEVHDWIEEINYVKNGFIVVTTDEENTFIPMQRVHEVDYKEVE